ncbi:MAG: hypothetical protein AseanaTS_22660 [Candidatus Pelagadaptatus aseana]
MFVVAMCIRFMQVMAIQSMCMSVHMVATTNVIDRILGTHKEQRKDKQIIDKWPKHI